MINDENSGTIGEKINYDQALIDATEQVHLISWCLALQMDTDSCQSFESLLIERVKELVALQLKAGVIAL